MTVLVTVFHLLLLWMGTGGLVRKLHATRAEQRLWARFVGLMFVVLVTFANAALETSRSSERMAALFAISLLAAVYFDWRRGLSKLDRQERDVDR
jgi:hypothetical protein